MSPYNIAFKRAAVLGALIATAIPALADDPVSIRGYFDTSFEYASGFNGNKGTEVGMWGVGGPAAGATASTRVFDTQGNGFRWQQGALFLTYTNANGFGGLVNLTAGNDANVLSASTFGEDNGDMIDLTQAYISFTKGAFNIEGGKFVTLAGQEVIDSSNNWNFSRGILFGYAIPYTHTGLRASTTVGKLGLTAGINDGWNELKDNNTAKTFEGQISLAATPKATAALTVYTGDEPVNGLDGTPVVDGNGNQVNGNRTLFDGLLTYKWDPTTTIVVEGDYGTQKGFANAVGTQVLPNGDTTAKWKGVGLFIHKDINEKFGVTLRGETFGDTDGLMTGGVPKWWSEGTLTLHYKPTPSHEFKFEVREDHVNGHLFDITNNPTITGNQYTSYGVEWIYKF